MPIFGADAEIFKRAAAPSTRAFWEILPISTSQVSASSCRTATLESTVPNDTFVHSGRHAVLLRFGHVNAFCIILFISSQSDGDGSL